MKGRPANGRIPALDGLRGIAIISVFLFHRFGGTHSSSLILRGINTVTTLGWTGVELFFVLSGFLITGILMETRHDPERARSFYTRRALRIFPIFYATAAVLIILAPWLKIHWQAGHFGYLLYASNFCWLVNRSLDNPSPYISLGHLWSLSVEEQFYLLWPAVVWNTSASRLVKICVGIVVLSPIIRLLLDPEVAYRLVRWDGFAMGAAVAVAWRYGKTLRYGILCFVTGLAGFLAMTGISGNHMPVTRLTVSPGISFAGLSCMGALICSLNGGRAAAFLSHRFLRLAGRYSYGIYIFHAVWYVPYPRGLWGQALWFVATSMATIVMALLSYHFLETPFLRLKDKWPRKTLAPAVLSAGHSF
jgi:peptidoglycan/LPS O-acetylase OafA/YrhL